ncbi:transmembrane reductase CYB561D2-like [Neodiprion pinetum]|uniref:transmembrane reductase CYB561D2-like n=1 Tax=Neodiprion pinetum TaxID=441929 RepID=UPI003712C6FD
MITKKDATNWTAIGMSFIIHLIFFGPAVYIVVLCAQLDYSLFIWHPICFTVGCCLLMTEAILGISGEALLSSKMPISSRIKLHWILHFLGLGLLAVGLGTIIAHRIQFGSLHAAFIHGKLGVFAIALALIVAMNGVLCLGTGMCCAKASITRRKVLHGCGGIFSTILILASQITGIYTSWWPSSEIDKHLTGAAYFVGGILLLAKPLHTTILRMRKVSS